MEMLVEFKDGRHMVVEPGVTFTSTNNENGKVLNYICFTDHRTTGPWIAKKKNIYYFKVDETTGETIFSDNDEAEEVDMVKEALAQALDCPSKGMMCLFELVVGEINNIKYL